MTTKKLTNDDVCNIIVNYFSNAITVNSIIEQLWISRDKENAIYSIMWEAQQDRDSIECDDEWPNAEQDSLLDRVLVHTSDRLLSLANA